MKFLRLLLIIILVVAVIAGFGWLAMQSGEISYTGGPVDVKTSPLVAALALLLITLLLAAIWGLVGWLIALPSKIRKASLEGNRRKAIDFVGNAFAAYESGDYLDSRRQAQKALNLLPDNAGIQLMNARYAAASEDLASAEKLFGELTQVSGFEVAARKGLAEIAQANNNFAAAISHADAALQVSKKATWPVELIFKERVNNADWDGALIALDDAEKRGLVGKRTAARRRAVVLTAAAHRAEKTGDLNKAVDYASRAVRLVSGFAPAAVMAARLQNLAGKNWAAASTIEQAWETEPHPALAIAYKDLKSSDTKASKAKWAEALVRIKPEHRESKILQAEIAIDEGNPALALSILDALIKERPTSRLLALKSHALLLQGDKAGADNLLHQAAVAAREPDWTDLDPDGVAFAYEDEDWARMVESYGDKGQLIHPRLERLQPSKTVKKLSDDKPAAIIKADADAQAADANQIAVQPPADGLDAYSHLGETIDEKPKKNWFGL